MCVIGTWQTLTQHFFYLSWEEREAGCYLIIYPHGCASTLFFNGLQEGTSVPQGDLNPGSSRSRLAMEDWGSIVTNAFLDINPLWVTARIKPCCTLFTRPLDSGDLHTLRSLPSADRLMTQAWGRDSRHSSLLRERRSLKAETW